jgi:hypothetical protein
MLSTLQPANLPSAPVILKRAVYLWFSVFRRTVSQHGTYPTAAKCVSWLIRKSEYMESGNV